MNTSLYNAIMNDPLGKQLMILEIQFAIFSLIISIILFFLFRPIWCWYFRINESIALLSEIRNALIELKGHGQPENAVEIGKGYSDSPVNIKIGANLQAVSPMPVSKCSIDKPMHPSATDKKWMPPATKK